MARHEGGRRWAVGAVSVACLAGCPASWADAQALPHDVEEPSAAVLVSSPNSRVRGLDEISRTVLRTAVACSPTVARMIVDLEASDLIVGIEARPLGRNLLGDMRIVTAAAGTRYVRIRLRIPATDLQLVSVLGHELQHATEVAAAADVRDGATQRAFYRQVGYERMGGGLFETEAALAVEEVVEREARECGRARVFCRK